MCKVASSSWPFRVDKTPLSHQTMKWKEGQGSSAYTGLWDKALLKTRLARSKQTFVRCWKGEKVSDCFALFLMCSIYEFEIFIFLWRQWRQEWRPLLNIPFLFIRKKIVMKFRFKNPFWFFKIFFVHWSMSYSWVKNQERKLRVLVYLNKCDW